MSVSGAGCIFLWFVFICMPVYLVCLSYLSACIWFVSVSVEASVMHVVLILLQGGVHLCPCYNSLRSTSYTVTVSNPQIWVLLKGLLGSSCARSCPTFRCGRAYSLSQTSQHDHRHKEANAFSAWHALGNGCLNGTISISIDLPYISEDIVFKIT